LHERDEPYRGYPYRLPGRRDPLDSPSQRTIAEVEDALVSAQPSVADVERRVVHEQADYLAVGDVDERVPYLGVAVARLGVGQRMRLVEAVEVRARHAVGLALLEVRPQPDVPIGEGRSTRSGQARRCPARSRGPPTARPGSSG